MASAKRASGKRQKCSDGKKVRASCVNHWNHLRELPVAAGICGIGWSSRCCLMTGWAAGGLAPTQKGKPGQSHGERAGSVCSRPFADRCGDVVCGDQRCAST